MLSFNWNNTGVTVELGDLVDSGVDIWAFDYPVPAQTVTYNGKTAVVPFNKEVFEQKIIDHYRFRQIGQETVGRWLHYFRTRIREIMPYYIQLYEFEAKWFNIEDPLESYNLSETFQQETTGTGKYSGTSSGTSSGETTSTSSGTSSSTTSGTSSGNTSESANKTVKFSDTPQGSISNLDNYLTNATKEDGTVTGTNSGTTSGTTSGTSSDESTGTSSGTSSGTTEQTSQDSGTTSHTLTRRGNIGVQPLGTEVRNIRDAFINIDLMVINELKDLFIMVY